MSMLTVPGEDLDLLYASPYVALDELLEEVTTSMSTISSDFDDDLVVTSEFGGFVSGL